MRAAVSSLLLGVFFLFAPTAHAQDYDFPQLTGRVVDEANILDPATEIDIDAKLEELEKKTSTQFVVVTLKSLRGRTIEEYGYRLGRHWGIGQKGTNNGVLLVVAPNERKVRIEVGYGLEGTLTDAISSVIIQGTILPRFRTGDYQGGIRDGVNAVLEVLSGNPDKFKPKAQNIGVTILGVLAPIIFSVPGLVLTLILIHFMFRAFVKIGEWLGLIPPQRKRKRSSWSWIDTAGAGSYSGYWGSSGSSWSSGGGGGGFSGGGGSFGGGGSSGSW
jgi:uncharacterized protein